MRYPAHKKASTPPSTGDATVASLDDPDPTPPSAPQRPRLRLIESPDASETALARIQAVREALAAFAESTALALGDADLWIAEARRRGADCVYLWLDGRGARLRASSQVRSALAVTGADPAKVFGLRVRVVPALRVELDNPELQRGALSLESREARVLVAAWLEGVDAAPAWRRAA